MELLGYEAGESGPVTGASFLSRKDCGVAVVVFVALVLLGVVYTVVHCHAGETLVPMAQTRTISEDIVVVPSPVDTGDFFDTSQANEDEANGQDVSYKCIGPYYPILVGLLACPGQ
jgi:hypothetical protein